MIDRSIYSVVLRILITIAKSVPAADIAECEAFHIGRQEFFDCSALNAVL